MNKRIAQILLANAALAAALAASALPAAAADVGVSLNFSQPGVYGRVDIGRFPRPDIVVAQPVVVVPPARNYRPDPVYLWVPPAHRTNWRAHCGQYGACGVPVYFVQDRWYDNHVRPYRVEHRGGPPPRRDWHDDRRQDRREDRREDRRDDRRDDRHDGRR